MSKVDLSIIILNFNGGDFIKENLTYLEKTFTPEVKTEVIVADNGSTDGSFEAVRKEFKWVVPVDNKKNLGFSTGNNRAVPLARGRYILFLNPDMRIEDRDIWPKLINKLDTDKKIGALGVRVVFADGRFDPDSYRGFPSLWNSFTHFSNLSKVFKGHYLFDGYHLGHLDPEREHEVEALPGSFLLVRREAGEEIGWWDEDYFFYGEDLEFGWDLKEKGWRVVYSPLTTVTHYKSVLSGIRKETEHLSKASIETKRRIAHESVEAMRIFYKKHYNEVYPKWVKALVFNSLNLLEKRRVSKYK